MNYNYQLSLEMIGKLRNNIHLISLSLSYTTINNKNLEEILINIPHLRWLFLEGTELQTIILLIFILIKKDVKN